MKTHVNSNETLMQTQIENHIENINVTIMKHSTHMQTLTQ